MRDRERSVVDEIHFHRLTGDDGTAPLDWRFVAGLLADELDALVIRFGGAPGITAADEERIARAAVALRQYRAACIETDDPD